MDADDAAVADLFPSYFGIDSLIACQSESFDSAQRICVPIDAGCSFVYPAWVSKCGSSSRVDSVKSDQRVEVIVHILWQRAVRERL